MNQPEQRPRAVSDILESGVRLAAGRALVLLRITASLILPIGVLLGAVIVWLAMSSGSKHLAIGILVPVAVLYVLALVVAGAACLKLVAEARTDAEPNARAAITFALRRLGPVFFLTVLLLVGAAPAIAVLVLPIALALGRYSALLTAFGLLSLWFSGTFAVAVPAMLLEEKGVVESLRRSAGLVRRRFWRALGTVLFGGIIALFAGVIVAIVASFFRFGDGKNAVLIVSLAGVGLGLLFVAPLYVSFLVVLFDDLRARERDLSAMRTG